MPSPHRPDHSSPPRAPQVLLCPRCGERMRLVSIEPLFHYTNLDEHTYICECGEDVSNLVARPRRE
jgi:hypothetical protein